MDLTLLVHEENGSLWAEVEELPGCFAAGEDLAELREALVEAVGFCVERSAPDRLVGCAEGLMDELLRIEASGGGALGVTDPAVSLDRGSRRIRVEALTRSGTIPDIT